MSARDPRFSIQRTFYRGEVYWVTIPSEPQLTPDDSYVMHGRHRVVVLYDSEFPRNSVSAIPICSLYDDQGDKRETIVTDLILDCKDYDIADAPYNGTIRKDSFIKTEQLRPFTRHWLEQKAGKILPEDMVRLDLRLITALQLQDTVGKLVEAEVLKRITDQEAEEA